MYNTISIINNISQKKNIPCIKCNYYSEYKLDEIIKNDFKKFQSGQKLNYLILDIKKYASVPYFNNLIKKINKLYMPLVMIQYRLPTDIWQITESFIGYNIVDNQINQTLTVMFQSLNDLQKNKPINNNSWKNPNIHLFCNRCKEKTDYCLLCDLNNITNINNICEECWNDIKN